MAFLDFGNTVEVGRNTTALWRRAMVAAMQRDSDEFAAAMAELGYVRYLSRLDREAMLTQAALIGDWYMRDEVLTIDPDYVAGVVAALIDPRAFEGSMRLVRQIKIPPEEIWLRRVETSVLAVLGQLRATGNWHRIMMEGVTGEPATELGRLELEFWERRGFTSRGP
jgi:predicted unusual protein kinase regulating ubiquinone biosynthesis (AarF/ABC1/UbiB family)